MSSPDNLTKDQLNLIYNNTNDLIFLIGVEGNGQYRVLSVNRSYLENTGRREEQMIGLTLHEALDADQAGYVASRYDEAVKRGGPFRYETRTELHNETRYIDTTLVPVNDDDGRTTHLIGVSRDITALKYEQKALRDEKERAENYLNIAEALIVAIDRDLKVTMMNRKGYNMLGYLEGSLIGVDYAELCIEPEKREQFREGYRRVLESGEVNPNVNYIRTKSGKKILISWANAVIRDEDGKVAGVLSSGEDITDRHNAEKAMIASQRQMAAGEVVSAVAHDFNNSLQGILGNIEIALSRGELSPEVSRYLETAVGLATDAAKRIQLLQRFSGPAGERLFEPVDINLLVDEVIDQTRHLWRDEANREGRTIEIERAFAAGSPSSEASRSELRSVLYNVVKNSIEALTEGGVLRFETASRDGFNVITVTDSGIGMDIDTSTRIFQPFFSTKGMEAGRGLGMSASQTIVQTHGGEVCVKSSFPGEGTAIEIRLPVATDQQDIGEEGASEAATSQHRILWVDDDPEVRSLAARYIEALGYEGDVAESGEAALDLMKTVDYSVVLTDVGMPGMTGIELAERIAKDGNRIPVIALTGWGESAMPADDDRHAIMQVLAKPIRLNELKEVLSAVGASRPGA